MSTLDNGCRVPAEYFKGLALRFTSVKKTQIMIFNMVSGLNQKDRQFKIKIKLNYFVH